MVYGFFHPYYVFVRNLVIDYPSSKSLTYNWNHGSMIAILMIFQVITGLLLILYYIPSELEAFTSIDYMTRESVYGFVFRAFHLNCASFLFVFMYLHVVRGLYYCSYRLLHVWSTGSVLLLLVMVTAFLGYVLPMGQMSFWGATVITNLVSVIPYIGTDVVLWMWGGFSINKASLSFFFLLHFLLPFIILVVIFFHLLLLHMTSSTSVLLVQESLSKVKFFPYYVYKDIINLVVVFIMFGLMLFNPWMLGDADNWLYANPLSSPVHIQPEWYFLFAYAILRCIPNKLGGVIALCMSVLILPILSFLGTYKSKSRLLSKIFMVFLGLSFLLLTWLGACPVEEPYITLSQIFTIMYFGCFALAAF